MIQKTPPNSPCYGCPGWHIADDGRIEPCPDCDLGRSFEPEDAGAAAQAWAWHFLSEGHMHAPRPSCEGEGGRCLGWNVFLSDKYGFQIERDDQCGLFDSDEQAVAAARRAYNAHKMMASLDPHIHDRKLLRVVRHLLDEHELAGYFDRWLLLAIDRTIGESQ